MDALTDLALSTLSQFFPLSPVLDLTQPLKWFWLELIEMESVTHKRSDPPQQSEGKGHFHDSNREWAEVSKQPKYTLSSVIKQTMRGIRNKNIWRSNIFSSRYLLDSNDFGSVHSAALVYLQNNTA